MAILCNIKRMNKDLIVAVENKVLETYEKAQRIFGRIFELPRIDFDLKGRVGGRAWRHNNSIEINAILLQENKSHFLAQTVPHECAHLICDSIYPSAKQGHGPEWKGIMIRLGLPPVRCHSYDLSSTGIRRVKTIPYHCIKCGEKMNLSLTMHNRLIKFPSRYFHVKCHGLLVTDNF